MKDTHRLNIGSFQCLLVNDGGRIGSAGMLFANAPQEQLQLALQRSGLEADHLPSTWSCLLVKTADHLLLVDTGYGPGSDAGGQLMPLLQAEGIQPKDIDRVILTHAHPDHIGGTVDAGGKAAFPAATYHMWHKEWDFWTGEANLVQVPAWAADFARRKLPPLSAHMRPVDAGTEVVPGIQILSAPGHTPGHSVVEISSGDETLLFMADVALHPLQIEFPQWTSRLDLDPQQTVATRHKIYQRAVENKALVLAFHFHPFPSLGYITGQEGRWHWEPWTLQVAE